MGEILQLNCKRAYDTAGLEFKRRNWNVMCSGEMLRYITERRS